MLPEKHRLQTDYDFRMVKKRGKVVRTPYFTLLYRRGSSGPSRFGFIASSKFDKRAVMRNRARRLMREAVRAHLSKLENGYDVILIARPGIKDVKFQEVNASFNKILPKVPFA